MPDILFGLLADRLGLDPRRDFSLRYVPTPFDAIQLLLTRRADHALLPEPAVSMVLRKSESFPVSIVAPSLYRGVDLSQAWGRILDREPRIPQAGIAAVGLLHADARLADRVGGPMPIGWSGAWRIPWNAASSWRGTFPC